MKTGVYMFPTEYSIRPDELANESLAKFTGHNVSVYLAPEDELVDIEPFGE